MFDTVLPADLLDVTDCPFDARGRIVFQSEGQCEIKEKLRVRGTLDFRIQRGRNGKRQIRFTLANSRINPLSRLAARVPLSLHRRNAEAIAAKGNQR